MTSAKVFSRPI